MVDIDAARNQTERMLKEAEKAIGEMPQAHAEPALRGPKQAEFTRSAKGPRSAEHCMPRLQSARAAFETARDGSPLEQRNAYVRAAFQAGQALSCARVTKIGKKMGHMPSPKKPKKAKAKP